MGGGQILGSPIEMAGHPYNNAALPCCLWFASNSRRNCNCISMVHTLTWQQRMMQHELQLLVQRYHESRDCSWCYDERSYAPQLYTRCYQGSCTTHESWHNHPQILQWDDVVYWIQVILLVWFKKCCHVTNTINIISCYVYHLQNYALGPKLNFEPWFIPHLTVHIWLHSDAIRVCQELPPLLLPRWTCIFCKSLLTVLLQFTLGLPGPLLYPGICQYRLQCLLWYALMIYMQNMSKPV